LGKLDQLPNYAELSTRSPQPEIWTHIESTIVINLQYISQESPVNSTRCAVLCTDGQAGQTTKLDFESVFSSVNRSEPCDTWIRNLLSTRNSHRDTYIECLCDETQRARVSIQLYCSNVTCEFKSACTFMPLMVKLVKTNWTLSKVFLPTVQRPCYMLYLL